MLFNKSQMLFDFHIREYIWSFLLKMNWISVLLASGILLDV